ncbi:MAG TPA: GlsB/YeaQ/YmgE family stress response membrane protein [Rhizomicrobium sp.]
MSVLGWIILGLISGFVASKVVNDRGEGCFLNIALGLVGAMVGGWLFTAIGGSSITGFNLYSMLVAIIGAIVALLLWHAITGRRTLK